MAVHVRRAFIRVTCHSFDSVLGDSLFTQTGHKRRAEAVKARFPCFRVLNAAPGEKSAERAVYGGFAGIGGAIRIASSGGKRGEMRGKFRVNGNLDRSFEPGGLRRDKSNPAAGNIIRAEPEAVHQAESGVPTDQQRGPVRFAGGGEEGAELVFRYRAVSGDLSDPARHERGERRSGQPAFDQRQTEERIEVGPGVVVAFPVSVPISSFEVIAGDARGDLIRVFQLRFTLECKQRVPVPDGKCAILASEAVQVRKFDRAAAVLRFDWRRGGRVRDGISPVNFQHGAFLPERGDPGGVRTVKFPGFGFDSLAGRQPAELPCFIPEV